MSNKTMIFGKPPRIFLDRVPVNEFTRSWCNQNFGTGKPETDGPMSGGVQNMHEPVLYRFPVPGAAKPQTGTQVVDSKKSVKA